MGDDIELQADRAFAAQNDIEAVAAGLRTEQRQLDEHTPPTLRMHAEYRAWPTWITVQGGGEDNPDPHDLPLPTGLADALCAWSDEYDALFDPDDFSRALFSSPEHEADFDRRGLDLAQRAAESLGESWVVQYRSSTTGDVSLG